QPHLGDQPGKARACVDPGGRVPQVLVDHHHPRRRPAQRNRALGQPVLQPRRLLVIVDLGGGGLAAVDRRQPGPPPPLDLAPRPPPPRPRRSPPPPAPSARPAGPADGSRPAGSPPGTPPTPARLPAPAGSRGHGSISRHRSPPMSALACTSRSRRTSAATA